MATQALTPPRVERATDITLPIVLRLSPVIEMTDAEFLAFCEQNHEARIERTAEGELEIMPPAGMYSSNRNSGITTQLESGRDAMARNRIRLVGRIYLAQRAVRAPDAAWIPKSRLVELTAEDKRGFGHICLTSS